MRKIIEKVRKGEIIVDGRTEIKVEKVEPYSCSSLGTHINSRYCYDRGSIVRTKTVRELSAEEVEAEYERFAYDELPSDREENLLSALLGGLTRQLELEASNRIF